jgi:hypothetical protein
MNRFLDLKDQVPELGPGRFDFQNPDRLFPAAVAESRLHLWKPGDPIADRGTRILVGAATWSGYDMHLLDVIDEALGRMNSNAPRVDVFNAGALTSQEAFADYIPELGEIGQLPVAGIWRDGRLTEKAFGYFASKLVAPIFGTTAEEIVKFIRDLYSERMQKLNAPH